MTRKVKSYLSGMKVVIDETELDHMSQQCEPSGERLLLLLLLLLLTLQRYNAIAFRGSFKELGGLESLAEV